jgi:hypothetical protein
MNDVHLVCTNCSCHSTEIVKAGGCPQRDPGEPNFAYPDPLEPHPLVNWRESLWLRIGVVLFGCVGVAMVLGLVVSVAKAMGWLP